MPPGPLRHGSRGSSTGAGCTAVAAAASPQLQAAIGSREAKRLERFARRNGPLIEVCGPQPRPAAA